MGLKIGVAAIAALEKKYIVVGLNGGKPFRLARVMCYFEDKRLRFYLVYPEGTTASLQMIEPGQLDIVHVYSSGPWVPSQEDLMALHGVLPKERIMFDGGYEVREVPATQFA